MEYTELSREDKKYIEFEEIKSDKIIDFITFEALYKYLESKQFDFNFIDKTIGKVFNEKKDKRPFNMTEAKKEIIDTLKKEYPFLTFKIIKNIDYGTGDLEKDIEMRLVFRCLEHKIFPNTIDDNYEDSEIDNNSIISKMKINLFLSEKEIIERIKEKKKEFDKKIKSNPDYLIIKKLINTRSQLGALTKGHPELKKISRQMLYADMFFIYDYMKLANYEKEKDIKSYYSGLFGDIKEELTGYYIKKLVNLGIRDSKKSARRYIKDKDSNTIRGHYSLMYEFIDNKKFELLLTIPE